MLFLLGLFLWMTIIIGCLGSRWGAWQAFNHWVSTIRCYVCLMGGYGMQATWSLHPREKRDPYIRERRKKVKTPSDAHLENQSCVPPTPFWRHQTSVLQLNILIITMWLVPSLMAWPTYVMEYIWSKLIDILPMGGNIQFK